MEQRRPAKRRHCTSIGADHIASRARPNSKVTLCRVQGFRVSGAG